MRRSCRIAAVALLTLAVGAGALVAPALGGELNQDEAALVVLESARRACNEKNYPAGAERFREFLRQYGGHKDAPAAHYGLALALIEGPQKDYQAAIQSLQQAAGRQDFAERPFALYYMGVALRSIGEQSVAQAEAKPNEAQGHMNTARQRFGEAMPNFAAAAELFIARAKAAPAAAGGPPSPDTEWAARARCDQCDMLLRSDRLKEAGELAAATLADPMMAKTRYRDLASYHLGYVLFAQKDYLAAGRVLSRLAPFQQEFGVHARYLLARTHHMLEERPEAASQYKAALADYEQQKKAAQEALKNPAALEPERKVFLERLASSPVPTYIERAMFYLALLACEEGRYGEAIERFTALLQGFPKSPLVPEMQLRQGFCQMQLRNFPEAIKVLQPLCNHPELGDQATWWLARSQVGAADRNNAPAYAQALAQAIGLMRQAAERANQLAQKGPAAKVRRGDILIEVGDTMQLAKQYREAAGIYQTMIGESANPERNEEAMQRQVAALHLAGVFNESDALAARFEQTYPRSTLLPAVWFRVAENAYAVAVAAAAKPDLANRAKELERLFGEAIARYQRVILRFPEFQYAQLARQGMAMCFYQLGRCTDAIAALSAIPEMERNGDLATVPYLLADCLIRTLPSETEDALQAANVTEPAGLAAKLLEVFTASQPTSPQAPDALLKLGYCYQRIGALMADPAERQKVLMQARQAYEKLMQQFANSPLAPMAVFERAKCLVLQGDVGGATNEFNRFQGDPYRQSPVAPLAILNLATLQRAQNRPQEAEKVLAQCRAQHEGALLKDPARSDWVPMLQYEHALAIKETKKLPEARAVFEALAKQFPDHPAAANALWRIGQCRREELTASLAAAQQAMAKPGAKPEETAAAAKALEESLKGIQDTIDGLEAQADAVGRRAPGSEAHLRMLYETAWCYRVLAGVEIEAARQKLQQAALDKLKAAVAKQLPQGQQLPPLVAPAVPLSAVSLRRSEQGAREQYRRLIAAASNAPLAVQARLELAEMLAERGEPDAALPLLAAALEKDPPGDLGEQVRVRLAAWDVAKGDAKSATSHLQPVLANPKSPLVPQARYLLGETYILLQDWPKAIEQLVAFRDDGRFHNVPGVSDRALLALGRAYAAAGQWDPSRGAFETLVGRYGQSPWVNDALYGMGRAWQTMKQFDQAVNAYVQVTRRTVSEVAAQAQLQMGLCRLEQQRFAEALPALLAVPYSYDYPESSAAAWCEAGRAALGLKQTDEAARCWRRVIQDYPNSPWANVARQRLAEIKEPAAP